MTRSIEFLDSSGHLSLEWEPTDAASVERARVEFEQLRGAGYSFFRVVAQEIGDFDPAHGALEVRRVDAAEVEPRLESVEPPAVALLGNTDVIAHRRRGRPPKALPNPSEGIKTGKPVREERVVAARPMRGG